MESQKPEPIPMLIVTWIDVQCFAISTPDPQPGDDLIIVHLQHSPGDSRPWSAAERNEFASRVLDAYRAVRVPAGETLAEATSAILAQSESIEDIEDKPAIRRVRHRSDTYDPER